MVEFHESKFHYDKGDRYEGKCHKNGFHECLSSYWKGLGLTNLPLSTHQFCDLDGWPIVSVWWLMYISSQFWFLFGLIDT